ncbi:hypothetical protein QYF36_023775 [Acer negundo]|nr:hypothetical protein QYF36_023775 [Acer negundo]
MDENNRIPRVCVDVKHLEVLYGLMVEKSVKLKKNKVWVPPIDPALKFNVDGSCEVELGRAGIGGVFCNSNEETKESLGGIHICIESDAKEVVSWVLNGDFSRVELVDIIYEIRELLSSLENVSVRFSRRDMNSLVDAQARRVSILDGDSVIWRMVCSVLFALLLCVVGVSAGVFATLRLCGFLSGGG